MKNSVNIISSQSCQKTKNPTQRKELHVLKIFDWNLCQFYSRLKNPMRNKSVENCALIGLQGCLYRSLSRKGHKYIKMEINTVSTNRYRLYQITITRSKFKFNSKSFTEQFKRKKYKEGFIRNGKKLMDRSWTFNSLNSFQVHGVWTRRP